MAWRLMRQDRRAYASALVHWGAFHLFPLPIGWVFKVVLDRVTHGAGAASPWSALAVLGGLELGRWALLVSAVVQWMGAWVGYQSVPQVNALESLVHAPGPAAGRLPGSPGDGVSRFRDDTRDLVGVLDVWLDITGAVLAALIAVAVMLTIDAAVTMAVLVPVVAALVVSKAIGPKLRAWRRAAREATANVTGFIGDTFSGILAVKAGGAEAAASRRFRALNAERARVSRKDEVGSQVIQTISGATGEVGVGLVLLFVAGALRRGSFTVGDLGLFASYMEVLAALPRWVGRLAAYHRQAEVSIARLTELMAEPDPASVVAPTALHLRHGPPPLAPAAEAVEPFRSLAVSGLTMRYPGGRGIADVSFTVSADEVVALTGPVGSGKSTLVRALLGLVRADSGEVRWNGVLVDEPSAFLVPPRVAYVPQVPRLFSEPLADTVLLGLEEAGLADAVWRACLEDDVADMPAGLATVVGPRGVRLSGGQLQRTAAARAFVRRPQLLVIDDLSSALDVETEAQVWDRLLGADDRPAVLVVTHRPRVLAAADQVIVLGPS
jgi:ATP-binding cassette subfamily B protein